MFIQLELLQVVLIAPHEPIQTEFDEFNWDQFFGLYFLGVVLLPVYFNIQFVIRIL